MTHLSPSSIHQWLLDFLQLDRVRDRSFDRPCQQLRFLYTSEEMGPSMHMRQYAADVVLGIAIQWQVDEFDIVLHAIELFDRFIYTKCVVGNYFVDELWMVPYMCAALWIALKFHEHPAQQVTSTQWHALLTATHNSVPLPESMAADTLITLEQDICFTLSFEIYFMTTGDRLHLLRFYVSQWAPDIHHPLQFLSMLSLIDASYLVHEPCMWLLSMAHVFTDVAGRLLVGSMSPILCTLRHQSRQLRLRLQYALVHEQFGNLCRLASTECREAWRNALDDTSSNP